MTSFGIRTSGAATWIGAMTARNAIRPTLRREAGRPGRLKSGRTRCTARDRKSTRLNSSHVESSYAVFCLKKKKKIIHPHTHTKQKQKNKHQNNHTEED